MTDPKPDNAIIPADPRPKLPELPADLEELIQAGQAELGAHIQTVGDATAARLAEVRREREAKGKDSGDPAPAPTARPRRQRVRTPRDARVETRQRESLKPIEELEALVVPTQVKIRHLSNTWSAIWSSIEESKRDAFQNELAKRLGLVRVPRIKAPILEFTEGQTAHHWKGEEARKDIERMLRFADTLNNILLTSNGVLQEMGIKLQAGATSPDRVPLRTSAVAPATPDAAVSSGRAVPAARETSASMGGDAVVAKRLGFLEDLRSRFFDRYNAASLRLDEVERSAKDERQYRALRETLASIQADFQLSSDPVTLQRYAAGEMEVASGSTKVSDGYLDIVDQLKTLTERVELVVRSLGETAAEKESKREAEAEFRERLERVKDLIAMGKAIRQYVGTKWEKKVRPQLERRASGQYRYLDVHGLEKKLMEKQEAHQWQGEESARDRRQLTDETLPMLEEMVGHMRDIATEMRAAGEISQTKDDKAITPDKVREVRLARERFEQKLEQTVVAFAANLDGKLRQQGKDATYRMSALLSHLPTVVDALIEKLKGNLVLSPAEKKAMLKQCNAAVIDSVSD